LWMVTPSTGNVTDLMDVLVILLVAALPAALLFLPIRGARHYQAQHPAGRFHEADAVLSRRLLVPGTRAYRSYYESRPGAKASDDRSRNSPGLLSPDARFHDPATFSAARANFSIIEYLRNLASRPHASSHPHNNSGDEPLDPDSRIGADPEGNSRFIEHWLRQTGAHSVGFTALREYHLYSHKGRGPRSGDPVELSYPHAIAITVEMDQSMMQAAPLGTSVMESSEQYLHSGVLALKLAAFISQLGYQATAHIDGEYELICPLVAADAGLGTIGRMGLLMTPGLGPRVRISAVTTNLPLQYTSEGFDPTMVHFCEMCKKCAVNCPASAIPDGKREGPDGSKRWRIDSEKCYHYWTVAGTDCGRCVSVCPYSHSSNNLHGFARWGIKNNLVFRHLAVKLDDLIYGRKPPVRPLPRWVRMADKA